MRIRKILRWIGPVTAVAMAAQLAGCGGGGGDSPSVPQGTMRATLANTSAAACGYAVVKVTVATVRAVSTTVPANARDGNWNLIEQAPPLQVDLLKLNGAPLDLGMKTLPAGHYSQVILRLEKNLIWGKPASVVLPNGDPDGVLVEVGTAATDGIGIAHEFDVPANGQVDLVLDFDGCNSVRDTGNGLVLDPKITVTSAPRT